MSVMEQDPGGPATLAIPVRLGIVFDLDGTLIDSRQDIAAAANHALQVHGFPTRPVSEIAGFVGDGAQLLLSRAARLEPDAAVLPELFATYLAYYAAHPTDHTLLLPGAHAALAELSHLPLALCTNKPRSITDAVLATLRLPAKFRVVVAAGDLPRIKPDPLPLQYIADQLSLAPTELVMVGDGAQDILCAKAAGSHSVGVEGGIQGMDRLIASEPDILLRSLAELPSALARWLNP